MLDISCIFSFSLSAYRTRNESAECLALKSQQVVLRLNTNGKGAHETGRVYDYSRRASQGFLYPLLSSLVMVGTSRKLSSR